MPESCQPPTTASTARFTLEPQCWPRPERQRPHVIEHAFVAQNAAAVAIIQTRSDTTGFFNMLSMQPGFYEISTTAQGFDKQLQSAVRLTSGESLRVDVTLKLGTVQSEIAVTGAATLVNTTNSTLSGLVDDRRVQDLPLSGRN